LVAVIVSNTSKSRVLAEAMTYDDSIGCINISEAYNQCRPLHIR
jgi:hypothetical protein